MPALKKIIGRRIKERREAQGYTQEALAGLLETDPSTVGRWEIGMYLPRGATKRKMADILNTPVEELFAGELAHEDQSDWESRLEEIERKQADLIIQMQNRFSELEAKTRSASESNVDDMSTESFWKKLPKELKEHPAVHNIIVMLPCLSELGLKRLSEQATGKFSHAENLKPYFSDHEHQEKIEQQLLQVPAPKPA